MSAERFVIDTNVLSELARPAPSMQVVEWFRGLAAPKTSAVVCFELSRGIERLNQGRRRAFLEGWFAELLLAVEVLPVDEASALAAARSEAAALRRGKTVDVRDLLVAATAQAHGCAVATHNVEHLRGLGVVVYDPFTDQRTL